MYLTSIEKEALQKVKALIESHYQHHYSIAYLATIALMGRTKLVESFKNYFGVGLFEHLKDQRMKQARYLLEQTDEPVKVIAFKTGYRYAANFSAAFKKKYGSTPLQYRKLEYYTEVKSIVV